jgi:hypothetical protein
MIRATHNFIRHRSLLGAASVCLVLAVSSFVLRPASAEESFGSAIGAEDLAEIRGGDEATNSFNDIANNTTTQTTTATNQNNSIGGDAVSGNVIVSPGAFNDMHGMTNVVMNTAPQANVQGVMNMNLILH